MFSASNAPSLNTIRATGVKYSDVSSTINHFYSTKCGSNPNLTVVLQDGIYYSGGFIEDTDPFLSKDVDGSLVIYGIDDNKVSSTSAKIIRGNSISAYAFQNNSFASDINKRIVQLEVLDTANLTSI